MILWRWPRALFPSYIGVFLHIFPNKQTKFLGLVFIAALIYWVWINANHFVDSSHNYLFGLFLGLLPLLGGLLAIPLAKQWGLLKSAVGKAILFLALGLCSWGVGTLIFAYYNLVLQVEVPYPSLADAAYVISWPLWGIGIVSLSRATGAHFGLRKKGGKAILLVVPLIVIALSYYFLATVARGGALTDLAEEGLKVFFDLAYPIGDVVILTLATVIYGLSYKYFGGKYRYAIYLILAAFVLNYLADFSFSYTTTVETFYVAGWVDLIFLATMFALSTGVNLMDPLSIRDSKTVTNSSYAS